jgi:glycosyltransferase involved in cell wall biosynthesis
MMPVKVKYVLTHVIQYVAPLLQRLAQCPEIDLQVVFDSDAGGRSYFDRGFSREVRWDRSLLEGYRYTVLHPGAPIRRGFWGARGRGLARQLARGETEVVIIHGWSNALNLTAAVIALARGIAVLCRSEMQGYNRGRPWLRWWKPLALHPFLRRVDGLLAIGSLNREAYLAAGVRPERIFWAPYSVEPTLFQPEKLAPAAAAQAQARLGLSPGSLRILFVGKLIRAKRPDDVIAAAALMPARSRCELIFVGDGELRPMLEQKAREAGVRAHFAGFSSQEELGAWYALGDVLVLPSSYEPWGLVVNEAMTMGLPAIVSEVAGCGPDLVLEGRTGYRCRVGDVAAISRALQTLADSPEHLRAMKDAARERVQAFSIDATLAGYLEAIRTVAARARSGRAGAGGGSPAGVGEGT